MAKNPLNFKTFIVWQKDRKTLAWQATTESGIEHYTTDNDNGVPIFSQMTSIGNPPISHLSKEQFRYLRSSFLNVRSGIKGNVGELKLSKKNYYTIFGDETLYEFKKR